MSLITSRVTISADNAPNMLKKPLIAAFFHFNDSAEKYKAR